MDWGLYGAGAVGRRLEGHSDIVSAFTQCLGTMCSGSCDGSICMWRIVTLAVERVMPFDCGAVYVCWSVGMSLGLLRCGM